MGRTRNLEKAYRALDEAVNCQRTLTRRARRNDILGRVTLACLVLGWLAITLALIVL